MIFIELVVLIMIIIILKTQMSKWIGSVGEKRVKEQLNKLGQTNYHLLNDLLIPKEDGGTTQIDHVVISPYGIFVIETKNYEGWIIGDQSSKYWTQTIYRNKSRFYNPIWQNSVHVKAIKYLLGSKYKNVRMIPVVAFLNRATLKKLTVKEHVVLLSDLLPTIKFYTETVLSEKQIDYVVQTLFQANITGKYARKAHVKAIKKMG